MDDPLLDLLAENAAEESRTNAKVILLVSGMLIVGHVAPSVARDIVIGFESTEDDSAIYSELPEVQRIEAQRQSIINLTDVRIYYSGLEHYYSVPFLRIAKDRIDAWVSGAVLD